MRRASLIICTSVLLCFIIILNLFAGSLLCLVVSNESEEIYFSSIPEEEIGSELELIKIPDDFSAADEFQQMNDHEILYHKKLYDVVRHSAKNGFQYYYCVNDLREEKMLEQIEQCTASNLDYFNPLRHSIPLTFKLFVQESSMNVAIEKAEGGEDFIFPFFNQIHYATFFSKEIFSPPEIFIS